MLFEDVPTKKSAFLGGREDMARSHTDACVAPVKQHVEVLLGGHMQQIVH